MDGGIVDPGARRVARVATAAARLRRRICLVAGTAGATAILSGAVPAAASVLAWAIAGLGIGIAYPTATIAILEAAPAGREGEVSATMQIANALAIALGTGLGGDLVARVAQDGASPALGIGLVDVASIAACALAWVAVRGVAEPKPAPPARLKPPTIATKRARPFPAGPASLRQHETSMRACTAAP